MKGQAWERSSVYQFFIKCQMESSGESVRIQSWESRQKSLLKEGGFYSMQKANCVWASSRERWTYLAMRASQRHESGQAEYVLEGHEETC